VENDGVVAAEHITSVSGPAARLPLGEDLLVTATQVVGFLERDDRRHGATVIVTLLELEKLGLVAISLGIP
jgi:hypothetical protein